jgi:hypothetical protein
MQNTQLHTHANTRIPPLQVPDCVEVVIREVIELLIYNEQTRKFDVNALPATTSPAIRQYFESVNTRCLSPHEASIAWYPLCQELRLNDLSRNHTRHTYSDGIPENDFPGPGLSKNRVPENDCPNPGSSKNRVPRVPEYICTAPGGEAFELKPTMETVASALYILLIGSPNEHHTGGQTASLPNAYSRYKNGQSLGRGYASSSRPWQRLSDLEDYWNERARSDDCCGAAIRVLEQRSVKRSLMQEDGAMQEKAFISKTGSPFQIEITLVCDACLVLNANECTRTRTGYVCVCVCVCVCVPNSIVYLLTQI